MESIGYERGKSMRRITGSLIQFFRKGRSGDGKYYLETLIKLNRDFRINS